MLASGCESQDQRGGGARRHSGPGAGVGSSQAPGGKELEASRAKAWPRAAERSRLQGPREAPPGTLLTFSLLRKMACFLNRPMSPASPNRRGEPGVPDGGGQAGL